MIFYNERKNETMSTKEIKNTIDYNTMKDCNGSKVRPGDFVVYIKNKKTKKVGVGRIMRVATDEKGVDMCQVERIKHLTSDRIMALK